MGRWGRGPSRLLFCPAVSSLPLLSIGPTSRLPRDDGSHEGEAITAWSSLPRWTSRRVRWDRWPGLGRCVPCRRPEGDLRGIVRVALEPGRLVQEEDAMLGQAHLPRPGNEAAANEAGVGDGVVERAERAGSKPLIEWILVHSSASSKESGGRIVTIRFTSVIFPEPGAGECTFGSEHQKSADRHARRMSRDRGR
jgi:hypothetical protein